MVHSSPYRSSPQQQKIIPCRSILPCLPLPTATTHPNRCSCVFCISLYRSLAGGGWSKHYSSRQRWTSLCALCTQLTRAKGKLYRHEHGRICQRCHDNTRRPQHNLSLINGTSRSRKKRNVDEGKHIDHSNTSIAPPPSPSLPSTSLLDRNTWNNQPFQLIRGNRARIAMTKDWHRLVSEVGDGSFDGWTERRSHSSNKI